MGADLFDHAHLMGDNNGGDTEAFVDVGNQLQNRVGCVGVQSGCGFVAQQHLGIGSQGAGDGHTLLLSAGELCRISVGLVRKTHQLQQFHGALGGVPLAHAGNLHGETHVFQAGTLHEQVELLKNHGDAASLGAQLRFIHGTQVLSVDEHLALGGTLKHVDAAHQSGFSGAAHTDNAVNLAVRNLQVHVLQGLKIAVVCLEYFGYVF